MTVRGRTVLAGAWLFVAALWCGMLAFFGAFGARTVLLTAPSRHAAGAVNRALLDGLDAVSLGAVALLLVGVVVWNRARPWSPRARGLGLRLLAIAAVAAIASLYVITPEMMALRDRMGADRSRREDGSPEAGMGTPSRALVAHARRAACRRDRGVRGRVLAAPAPGDA